MDAVYEIQRRLDAVLPLASALPEGAILAVEDARKAGNVAAVLRSLATEPGGDRFQVVASKKTAITSFDHAIAAKLAVNEDLWGEARGALEGGGEALKTSAERSPPRISGLRQLVDIQAQRQRLRVSTYRSNPVAAGHAETPAVLLLSAPGIPIGLSEPWIRALATEHDVIAVETPGLFGTVDAFDDLDWSIHAQATYAMGVLDALEIDKVHLLGLCGGSAVALVAASVFGPRVRTLSLMHGDLCVASSEFRTQHQKDVADLMRGAGEDRSHATLFQRVFSNPQMLAQLPEGTAHYLLYPYATDELLYRYARTNGAIMHIDLRQAASETSVPTLLVTSAADDTAHPGASELISTLIDGAELHMVSGRAHIEVFSAPSEYLQRVQQHIHG